MTAPIGPPTHRPVPQPEDPLRLAAVSAHPRHALIGQLVDALNDLGWVLESHPYSNLALAIHFELSPRQLSRLRARLAGMPLVLSDPSLAALARLEATPVAELADPVPGSLHITFLHSEPDLHSEIPAVPG